MDDAIQEGATNCVVDCARVRKGNQVYIVGQKGAVDGEVSNAIQKIVERQEAMATVVWETAIAKNTNEVPQALLEAYSKGDIVISHFPSLKREILHPYVQGDTRSRATNR